MIQDSRLIKKKNAGGDSNISEAVSYYHFNNIYTLKYTETEIEYQFYNSPKIDYVMELDKYSIGVSVTRAMRGDRYFNKSFIEKLLLKKLNGVIQAKKYAFNIWHIDLLHVFVMRKNAHKVRCVIRKIKRKYKEFDNIHILVTILNTSQQWVLDNKLT